MNVGAQHRITTYFNVEKAVSVALFERLSGTAFYWDSLLIEDIPITPLDCVE